MSDSLFAGGMIRLARSPFFWLVLILLAAECFFRWSLPYRLVPRAREVLRNPITYRGWPEYLSSPDDDRPLVVLISHSQGVGEEIEDSSLIYAAELRDHLGDRNIRFENWSAHGLIPIELDLLIMTAVARGADLLVLALVPRNFGGPRNRDLTPVSDISLMAGDPRLWPMLPGSLTMGGFAFEDVLSSFLSLESSLHRSRIAVFDWISESVPLRWHKVLLGHERDGHGPRLDAFAGVDASVFLPSRDVNDAARTDRNTTRESGRMAEPSSGYEPFPPVYERLQAHLSGTETRWVWVWNPSEPSPIRGHPPYHRRFIKEATLTIEKSGYRSHDLSAAMDADLFLNEYHFSEPGHAEFAGLLKRIIDDEL